MEFPAVTVCNMNPVKKQHVYSLLGYTGKIMETIMRWWQGGRGEEEEEEEEEEQEQEKEKEQEEDEEKGHAGKEDQGDDNRMFTGL